MGGDDQINCVFKDILETSNTLKRFDSKTLSTKQQSTIIRSSQDRDDHFFSGFTEGVKYNYHKDCYTEHTSKQKINRHLKKQKLDKSESSDLSSPPQESMYNLIGVENLTNSSFKSIQC